MHDLSYRSSKTLVRRSPIHGKGLFATQPIAKGEIVAIKGGHILTERQWASLEPRFGAAEIQVAEGLFIAPADEGQRDGGMLYTNHSCDPNIALQGQIAFVAMRDIAPREELTHDWATTDDLDYVMACRCGSPTCRGTVTGKDWMKPELQEKYRGWFCWFLQRRIAALTAGDDQADATDRAVAQGNPPREGPPVELRIAGAADLAVLLPLVRAYHAFEGVEMQDTVRLAALSPLLAPDNPLGRLWLLGVSDRVVGYLALCFGYSIEFGGRDAFVDEFFIEAPARGKGLGTRALREVQRCAAALGIVALHLEVAAANDTAKRLYAQAGFRPRERYHLMSCPLDHGEGATTGSS